MWLKGREELHALAMLLQLLKEAELELIETLVTNCAPRDEATGLVPELEVSRKGANISYRAWHTWTSSMCACSITFTNPV
jgi:hypothetical protein